MKVFAYVQILSSSLKLGIVYLLVIGNYDKLILYSVLTLCVAIIIAMVYRIYCRRNFPESRYRFQWEREIATPMLKFSGWNLVFDLSHISKTEGVNQLLNYFFGVLINAAYGVANQVQTAINGLSYSFLNAVRPQIVKYYAAGEIDKMLRLVNNASKFSFLLMSIMSFL